MARNRRRGPASYRSAQVRAREAEYALSRDSVRDLAKTMRSFADDISRGVIQVGHGTSGAEASAQMVRSAAKKLERRLVTMVGENRLLSFQEIEQIWRSTGLELAKIRGLPNAMMGAVRTPPLTMMGAYESVGGAGNWKTLLPKYVGRAATEVDQIVRNALLQGASPEELARRLRPYVQGSEQFQQAFRDFGKIDMRTLRSPDVEGAAKQMEYNALRIAEAELHNARAEAEVQQYIMDPYIKCVAWRLSPDRGSFEGIDECDVLAEQDLYGLGDGVYPVNAVPLTPHPFDRCERVPILQDNPDAKPTPELKKDISRVRVTGLTKERADVVRDRVSRLVTLSRMEGRSNELVSASQRNITVGKIGVA